MKNTKIERVLLPIVRQYGFERVHQSLHEIGTTEFKCAKSKQNNSLLSDSTSIKSARKKTKVTALEYVSKMQTSLEKDAVIVDIARKFDDKSFLPTFGEISNFCQIHGIAELASKTRANFIPRIFKFIASMELDDIQRMLDNGMFSGPSRLGPIADAIRNSGRSTHSAHE